MLFMYCSWISLQGLQMNCRIFVTVHFLILLSIGASAGVADRGIYEMCKHTDTVTTPEGYIVSENYPSWCETFKDCYMNVVAQKNEFLELNIEEVDTWRTLIFCHDWISIHDIGLASPLLHKTCELTTDGGMAIKSSSNAVSVAFHSTVWGRSPLWARYRFRIHYKAIPKKDLTSTSRKPFPQTMVSPKMTTTYSTIAHTSEKSTEMQTTIQTAINIDDSRLNTSESHVEEGNGSISYLVGGIVGGVVLCAVIVTAVILKRKGDEEISETQTQQFSNGTYRHESHLDDENEHSTLSQTPSTPKDKSIGQDGVYDYACTPFQRSQQKKTPEQGDDVQWTGNDGYHMEDGSADNDSQTDWMDNDIYTSEQSNQLKFDDIQQTKSHEQDSDVDSTENDTSSVVIAESVSVEGVPQTEWTENDIYTSEESN